MTQKQSINMMREKIRQKASALKPASLIPKAKYINPFIESVCELFNTMLDCGVERESLAVRLKLIPNLDIVAFISLSGVISGTIALSFPTNTALAMVSRVYEKDMVVIDSTVIDAVGEFANVIAGSAQKHLTKGNQGEVELSVPTVIRGSSFSIEYPSKATWLEVPFSSELGSFLLRVMVKNFNGEHL